jgi:zinc protease
VQRFDADQLRAFHERVYCGENFLFAIAGDVEATELEKELRSLTSYWRHEKRLDILSSELPQTDRDTPGFNLIEKNSQQVTFNWGRLTLGVADRDSLTLQLATNIIAYRLFYKHVYEDGIAYRMWTLLPMRKEKAPFYFQTGVAPENFERARASIATEVERFLNEPIPQLEFERAQATLIQRYFLGQTTCATQSAIMAHYTYYGYDIAFLQSYPEHIRRISKEEVEATARRYIRMDDMVMVAVGKL